MVEVRLTKLFKAAEKKYQATRSGAESARSSEVWSSGQVMEIEPLENLRGGELPGKVLAKAPLRTSSGSRAPTKYCYWLNAKGQVIARMQGTEIPGQLFEEFFIWRADEIESVLYSASSATFVLNVTVRTLVGGRLDSVALLGQFGSRVERFAYKGDRLVNVFVDEMPHTGSPQSNVYLIQYAPGSGDPTRITQTFPNGREVLAFPEK